MVKEEQVSPQKEFHNPKNILAIILQSNNYAKFRELVLYSV